MASLAEEDLFMDQQSCRGALRMDILTVTIAIGLEEGTMTMMPASWTMIPNMVPDLGLGTVPEDLGLRGSTVAMVTTTFQDLALDTAPAGSGLLASTGTMTMITSQDSDQDLASEDLGFRGSAGTLIMATSHDLDPEFLQGLTAGTIETIPKCQIYLIMQTALITKNGNEYSNNRVLDRHLICSI